MSIKVKDSYRELSGYLVVLNTCLGKKKKRPPVHLKGTSYFAFSSYLLFNFYSKIMQLRKTPYQSTIFWSSFYSRTFLFISGGASADPSVTPSSSHPLPPSPLLPPQHPGEHRAGSHCLRNALGQLQDAQPWPTSLNAEAFPSFLRILEDWCAGPVPEVTWNLSSLFRSQTVLQVLFAHHGISLTGQNLLNIPRTFMCL